MKICRGIFFLRREQAPALRVNFLMRSRVLPTFFVWCEKRDLEPGFAESMRRLGSRFYAKPIPRVARRRVQTLYLIKHKRPEPFGSGLLCLVRETGLEPVRCEPHAPQTCASASSATLAKSFFDDLYIIHCFDKFVNSFFEKSQKVFCFFSVRCSAEIEGFNCFNGAAKLGSFAALVLDDLT